MKLDYKEIELDDREWMDPLFKMSGRGSLEYSFTTTFLWRCTYKYKAARLNDYLIILCDPNDPTYIFPAGQGPLEPVIQALIEDARQKGTKLTFNTILSKDKERLEQLYPGRFEFTPFRDGQDYVYTTQSLATLTGKKLAAKRNHIHRFTDNHPSWTYEPLTQKNMDETRQMNMAWCLQAGCLEDSSLYNESCAVEQAFRHFSELKLDGGVLRTEGRVVGFSIGDPLSEDTYLVHFEKAFADMQGAYPMINQQFVLHNCMDYAFVNREEDAGVPGLRQAKLSYCPDHLVEKYQATLVEA